MCVPSLIASLRFRRHGTDHGVHAAPDTLPVHCGSRSLWPTRRRCAVLLCVDARIGSVRFALAGFEPNRSLR
jgi:hypothetical protein